MEDFQSHCFVCHGETDFETVRKNIQFNLPVCEHCIGTEKEKRAVENLTEGMAEGFVCGCI